MLKRKKKSEWLSVNVGKERAKKMSQFPEVNWSEICRQAIDKYIEQRTTISS